MALPCAAFNLYPSSMAADRVLRMNGGVGETSYTNNSSIQKKMILKVKPILEESLKKMLYCTNFGSTLKVADLGCSSGPNALIVASDVTNIIGSTIHNMNREPPVLLIYLNDLFGNDFNTIFKLLPNFYQSMQQKMGGKIGACFINATPGNFYGRLFPNNYINFFHSSYSLHWLSQAPQDLTNGSDALNKGNIYITTTSPPEVYRAYFEQFQRDFKLFLRSRSEEVKPGGVMILTFIGREKPREISSPWVVMGTVLNDMVLEGLVEKTKLDFFNLPIYGPTAEEVKKVIESEGSFTIQTLKTIKIGLDGDPQEDIDDSVIDGNMRGELTTKAIRAVFEPLLEAVFGKDIMDEFFSRFKEKIAKLMEKQTLEYTNIVVSMAKDP